MVSLESALGFASQAYSTCGCFYYLSTYTTDLCHMSIETEHYAHKEFKIDHKIHILSSVKQQKIMLWFLLKAKVS